MAGTKKRNIYDITPTDGSSPYTVEADSYKFDQTSGRHLFFNKDEETDEVVANLLNVSVRRRPDA